MVEPANNTPDLLTEDQVCDFNREGFLVVDTLITPAELEEIRQDVIKIFEQSAGRDVGDQFDLAGPDLEDQPPVLSQIMYPAKYAPRLLESELLVSATAIVRQLLGGGAECVFEHAILKPAGHGAPTPWHQDAAYWPSDEIHQTVSIWVALQETTVENGCLHYVPESHANDVLSHQPIGNDPATHGLELTPVEMLHVQNAVACPLLPGQATIHGGYTLHSAGPNISHSDRIGLVLFGKCSSKPRTVRYDFPWQRIRKTARAARSDAAEKNKNG